MQFRVGVNGHVEKRLSRLVEHAKKISPEYAVRLDGIRGEGVGERLGQLPVLTRDQLRDIISGLTVRPQGRCARMLHTSGSSGQPLNLPATAAEIRTDALLWLNVYRRLGLRAWHRQAKFVFGNPFPPHWVQRLSWYRRMYCPATACPSEKVAWLRETRPQAVFGWASLLGEVARDLESQNERLRIPLIFSSSDMLWAGLRRQIADRLGGRVFDIYGAVETGPLAWECPVGGGYHVCADHVILEILDDANRPARRGRIVSTVLWRWSVPLIRYEMGDVGEWETDPCPCGRPWPRLRRLHGRCSNLLQLAGGEWISSGTLEDILHGVDSIGQFQFVQQSAALICLRLAPQKSFTSDDEKMICRRFDALFKGRLKLRVEIVPPWQPKAGSKFQPFVVLAK